METKHIVGDRYNFNGYLNNTLKDIENNDGIIIDIKYENSEGMESYSALIIYCSKEKYREIKINKILEQ